MQVMIGITYNYFLAVRICFFGCHTRQRQSCEKEVYLGHSVHHHSPLNAPLLQFLPIHSPKSSSPPTSHLAPSLNTLIWRNFFPSEFFCKVVSLYFICHWIIYGLVTSLLLNKLTFTSFLLFKFYPVPILSWQKKKNSSTGRNCHICIYLHDYTHSHYWVIMCLSMLLCKEAALRWLVLNHKILRSTYLKCKFGTYPGPPKFKVW